ncbi:hypothetical protein [Methylopila sp. M107]|uniref:hypothetical protein n=1 Tax=Methylopila sp. M107 TaxID=1101190 RepID=UPI0012DE3214|nr:hypothetical protein [Methylopila sp. M107]
MKVRRIFCNQPNCSGLMRLKPPRLLACERCGYRRVWERTPCFVPFCGRTFKCDGWDINEEVCCGEHWRTAPEQLRKEHARFRRRHRLNYRLWQEAPEGSEAQAEAAGRCDATWGLCHDLWLVIRSRILEAAGVMT